MPKTKFETVIFTAITAWIMVYIMTLYNTVLASGSFVNSSFLIALKSMWLEFVIIFFVCLFYIRSCRQIFCISRGQTGGSSHCDCFCHSDIYSGITGSTGKYYGCMARIWLHLSVHSRLSHHILPEFYYGTAAAVVRSGSAGKSTVSSSVSP